LQITDRLINHCVREQLNRVTVNDEAIEERVAQMQNAEDSAILLVLFLAFVLEILKNRERGGERGRRTSHSVEQTNPMMDSTSWVMPGNLLKLYPQLPAPK
jgi:hypothetical protein